MQIGHNSISPSESTNDGVRAAAELARVCFWKGFFCYNENEVKSSNYKLYIFMKFYDTNRRQNAYFFRLLVGHFDVHAVSRQM